MLSVPFGLLTTAILYANEIPDSSEDIKTGKFTFVSFFSPERAYIFYYLLICCAFLSIIFNVILKFIGPLSLFSLILILPAFKAVSVLKTHFDDKVKLLESSRLTIAMQAAVSVILIIGALI